MAEMGNYCKAYPVQRLRQFSGWKEKTQNLRPVNAQEAGADHASPRTLNDDDYLFLQENFVVTDGIFLDENIVFDEINPEWIEFCKGTLKFEAPA